MNSIYPKVTTLLILLLGTHFLQAQAQAQAQAQTQAQAQAHSFENKRTQAHNAKEERSHEEPSQEDCSEEDRSKENRSKEKSQDGTEGKVSANCGERRLTHSGRLATSPTSKTQVTVL